MPFKTVKSLQKGGSDTMDVHQKLDQLMQNRGWSAYRLSKECGLSESTIANILKRNATPSIATLESLCAGFGITLSQFFAEGEMIELTPDLKPLIDQWVTLTPSQKQAVLIMAQEMNNSKL